MTHPRPAPRAPIVWQDTRRRIATDLLEAVGRGVGSTKSVALAMPPGERPPRLPGQLWQRLAELEVATYGEPRPLPRFDVYVGLSPSLHFDPEARRRMLEREIEARRRENRANALRRLDAKGRPLYRLSLDGSGCVEAAAF